MARFIDFLENAIFGDKKSVSLNALTIDESVATELWSYKLALNIVAETYGTLLSKCEFKTYIKGEERKEGNYYLLNVEPNPNQSAPEFKKQLMRRLILNPNHDALVINLNMPASQTKQALYVASDFQKSDMQLYEATFTNVSVDVFEDGGIPIKGIYSGDRAIYIKYTNSQLTEIFSQMRELYSELIENAVKSGTYRQKYVLSMDQTATADPQFEEHMQQLLDEQFNSFITGKDSVIPLYAGMKLDQTSAGADLGQNASVANKSVNTINDEILSKVGRAFNLPKSVMLGDFEKDDLDNVLTYGLDSMANLISQAFNRKWYGMSDYKKGTYCRLDTSKARHMDMISIASASNGIISSGIYTINDVRKKLDEPAIDEEIGDVHFITRNYAVIGSAYLEDPTNVITEETGQAQDNPAQKNTSNPKEGEGENEK